MKNEELKNEELGMKRTAPIHLLRLHLLRREQTARPVVSLLLFLLLPLSLLAQKVYTPEDLPKVHLQNERRYTCNPDGILSAAATDSIDRMLYALERQTGIETVVAVVGSIGEEECFDFCHKLLNGWGVGKKGKNNGLVILLVTDQRCIQFYTGYGLEGDLPDAVCKRIQTQQMLPYLKEADWDAGMMAGVRAVCERLDGSMENDADEGGIGYVILIFLCLILIGIGLVVFAIFRSTRCPQCGKHELQRSGSQLAYRRGGVKAEDVTYICRHCGHKVVRRQTSYDEQYRGGGGAGPIIFGGGGGFGGGGFSGGSFGGGIGGGGGAGTRF